MAVAGLLVMALPGQAEPVSRALAALPGADVPGLGQEDQMAVVLEAPSSQLSERLEQIQGLEGVLSAFVTYVNIEDELEGGSPPDGRRAG